MPNPTLRSPRRDLAISAALVLAAAALAALLAARTPLGLDYVGAASTFCDCPGTPIRALAHGQIHHFLATQPVMGSASLLLRAPFAALGLHLTTGTELDLYRFGTFPCLFAAGLLAVYLFGRMRELGRPALALILVPGLLAFNPLTMRALRYGHPEEILASALCVAALLAACRRRSLLAGVLLGAAFATKQWALLAVLPAFAAAAPGERVRLGVAAASTAALLVVPVALSDLHRFFHANHGAGVVGGSVMPTNIWFPLGSDVPVTLGPNGAALPPRALSMGLGRITHPLILVVGFGLALLWWRRRGDETRPEDALVLLALIMLARCLLDPLTNSYYHLPMLMSLAAWEGLRRRDLPSLTVVTAVLLELTISFANGGVNAVVLNRFYLAWALPLAALLALLAFRPRLAAGRIAEPA